MNQFLNWLELDWTPWVPWAVFGLVASLAWLLLESLFPPRDRWEQRLLDVQAEGRNVPGRRRRWREWRAALSRGLQSSAKWLAKPLQPSSDQERGKLRRRLQTAGFRHESATIWFLALKLSGLACGLLVGAAWVWVSENREPLRIAQAIVVVAGSFYAFDGLLFWRIRRRQEAIFLGLPDALDLLVVCVESGLGLDQALQRVAGELQRSHAVLADEFALCNLHRQMGRSREQAWRELGERTEVADMRSLAALLIQADRLGSSVGQALRVQSDALRTRRRQMAEERAAQTSVKLVFPLAAFIFPGIFVVLAGPAAIGLLKQLFPALGN